MFEFFKNQNSSEFSEKIKRKNFIVLILFICLFFSLAFNFSFFRIEKIASDKPSANEKKELIKNNYDLIPDLLNKGKYNVKKIKNVVINSLETINNQVVPVQVFMDEYFPEIEVPTTVHKKFPLIIITHPTIVPSMSPAKNEFDYIAEHLVSHGYVVATYEWSFDMGQCEIFRNAERERSIVKYFEKKNEDKFSPFYNYIDINNIALIGHSNGAFAQYFAKEEKRVKAYVGFSGLLCEWGGLYQDIVDLKKPFLYIGATKDQLRADTKMQIFYEFWQKHIGPKIMLDVKDGDHWQFTDDYVYYPDVILHYSQTNNIFKNLYVVCQKELNDNDPENDSHCNDKYVDREVQHNVVKYFATAFFEVYLKGNNSLKSALKNPDLKDEIANFTYENIE